MAGGGPGARRRAGGSIISKLFGAMTERRDPAVGGRKVGAAVPPPREPFGAAPEDGSPEGRGRSGDDGAEGALLTRSAMLRLSAAFAAALPLRAPADGASGTLGRGVVGGHELAPGAVRLDHLGDLPANSLIGRGAEGAGVPRALQAGDVRALVAAAGGELTARSATEAATLAAPPEAGALRTLGFHPGTVRGGARYVRAAAEPGHPGKLRTLDGAWWELAEPWPTPEMFGARGNGAVDDIAALEAALQFVTARGGGVISTSPRAVYGISRPFANLSGPNVVFDGGGLRTESFGVTTLRKLPGFSGEAAVIWGANPGTGQNSALRGGGIRGLRIDGAGQPGDGLIVRKVGGASFENIDSENNQGWGFVFDGLWIGSIRSCTARGNGGGFRFANTERKVSNVWLHDPHAADNDDWALLIESDPVSNARRPSQIDVFGGIFELPRRTGSLALQPRPIVQIEACNEVRFFGTHLIQRGAGSTPTEAPCLVLGKAGHALRCETVAMFSPRFQHAYPSPAHAVVCAADVGSVTIMAPDLRVVENASKVIDATAATAGAISVVGGGLARGRVTDPNARIAIVSGELELSADAPGGDLRLGARAPGRRLELGAYAADGGWRTALRLGEGASANLATLRDMSLRLAPVASAPANAEEGTLTYWNGAGAAPDGGANGPGLYLHKGAAIGWVFLR